MDKLELLANEVTKHIEGLGLICFPQAIDVESAELVVEWPGDDWKQFLSFAPRMGVSAIYVGTTTFEFVADDDDDEESLADLAEHVGQTESCLVAYVANGVLHAWSALAPWSLEATTRHLNNVGGQDARSDALLERAELEGWARTIAHDRRFFGASPVDRRSVTAALLAELSGLSKDDMLLDDFEWWVAREAQARLSEVRETLTDEGLAMKATLAAELARIHPEWSSMRVSLRETYARTLVKERLGMALPIVVEEVARHKVTLDD